MDVARARRVARPSWVNLRTVLGLLLFSAALFGGNRLLGASEVTTEVWVTTRDLAQDTVLAPGDVEPAAVKLPATVSSGYVSAAAPIYGEVVTRPMSAGELVSAGWLARSPEASASRSMTIPIEAEHAVGGALRPGDRVDVLVTFDAENVRARTLVLVRSAEVLDVVETGGLAFGEDALVGVTLAVGPEQATRLAFALRTGFVDIVRVDGPSEASERSSTVRSGDFP